MTKEEMITDEQLAKSFEGTNFGSRTAREVVDETVLKRAGAYSAGHTAESICKELGLFTKTGLSKIGKRYLYEVYAKKSQPEKHIMQQHIRIYYPKLSTSPKLQQLQQLTCMTQDGDLISKFVRDTLVEEEFCIRVTGGWNIITAKGILFLKGYDLIHP